MSFTVPLGRTVGDTQEEVAPSEPAASPARPRILVVDESPDIRELLKGWLEPEGYDLTVATSSDDVVAKAAEFKPDAITLSVLGPGQDGWDTLYQLKKNVSTASIPVMVVSVVNEPKVGLALATVYLVNPAPKEVLIGAIRRYIAPRSDGLAKVLVVDDESSSRELLKETLESEGYMVALANNGQEALRVLAQGPVAAILLDLMMPEMDGFDLLSRMKENSDWRGIPVFVLTGKELTHGEAAILRRETNEFLQKGAEWKDQLLSGLRHAVGVKGGSA